MCKCKLANVAKRKTNYKKTCCNQSITAKKEGKKDRNSNNTNGGHGRFSSLNYMYMLNSPTKPTDIDKRGMQQNFITPKIAMYFVQGERHRDMERRTPDVFIYSFYDFGFGFFVFFFSFFVRTFCSRWHESKMKHTILFLCHTRQTCLAMKNTNKQKSFFFSLNQQILSICLSS